MNEIEVPQAPAGRYRWVGWVLRSALALFVLAVLYIAGIVYLPRVRAARFEPQLKQALEQSLGRKVELRDVRLSLYPSPGLSAKDLVIHDAPEFGLEPFAYVEEIRVGVRWLALFGGKIEPSSVRLLNASVNLTRSSAQEWNFAIFLSRMGAGLAKGERAPKLEVRDSRINFRDGVRKSPFFLNAVDLDLDTPPGAGDTYSWRYEASPARTDRSEQGFGRFSGTGTYQVSGGGRVDLDIELERSVIGEVLTMVIGRDPGVQGRLSSRAHLSGPLSNIEIRGQLKLGDLERASLFNARGRDWSMNYQGSINAGAQSVTFKTVPAKEGEALPVSIDATGTQLLKNAEWHTKVALDGLSVASMLEMAGRLGVAVPRALVVEGTLTGAIDVSTGQPVTGEVELRDGAVKAGAAGPFKIAPAKLSFEQTKLRLESATMQLAKDSTAEFTGFWELSDGSLELGATLKHADWKQLRGALDAFPAIGDPAALDVCDEGALDGDVHFSRAAETSVEADDDDVPDSRFSGTLRLSNVRCAVDGAAEPVRIEHGQLTLAGPVWRLRHAAGTLGKVAWTGEASLEKPKQPVRFALALDTVTMLDLERVFQPSLEQRASLIDRTLKRKPVLPAWLAARHWTGSVTINKATLAGYALSKFSTRVAWNGGTVELSDLTTRYEESAINGRATIELGRGEPRYTVRGTLDGLEWGEAGRVGGDFEAHATGLNDALTASLKVTAQLKAKELEIAGETYEQTTADIDYDAVRSEQRLRFGAITTRVDGVWLTGTGGSAGDNRWRAEFTGATRALKLGGTFPPFRVDAERGSAPRSR